MSEIVISGERLIGEQPILRIEAEELHAYDAGSVTELLDALAPQTRSSVSDLPPIILVNGRIAGATEIDNLPPEAILRVDVLPEKSSLRYGLPDTQKVLNFILREHYRGMIAELDDNESTDGGGQSGMAELSRVRIDRDTETTLRLDLKESERLLESQRNILDADRSLRTLLPSTNEAKLAASLLRPVFSFRPSFEASMDLKSSNLLQGLAGDNGPIPAAAPSDPLLRQHTATVTTHLAARVGGLLGRLPWSATASYDDTVIRTLGGTGVDGAGRLLLERANSNLDHGTLVWYVGGPLAALPAGAALVNLQLGSQLQGIRTATLPGSAPAARNRLARTSGSAQLNGNLPLTSRAEHVLPFLGDLGLRFNGKVEAVSNFGLLTSFDMGLAWTMGKYLHLQGDFANTETAPTLEQLRNPPLVTPGVQLFDFVTSNTVFVEEITGGEPNLRRTDSRVGTLGVYFGPFLNSTAFMAKYEHRRVSDAVGPLPAFTAPVEDAFPERFVHDAAGNLIGVDDRAVNLAAATQDDLKWGVNLSLPLTPNPAAEHEGGYRLWMSLFDTWYFRDTIRVRAGVPELDLLNGAPLYVAGTNVSATQSRHAIEFRTTLRYEGFGARLRVRWRSATRVDGGESGPGSNLYFSDLSTTELRIFADLGEVQATKRFGGSKGLHVNLGVTNLFDVRQRVTDASGVTPVGFQPGYVDPLGRVLSFGVRKVF